MKTFLTLATLACLTASAARADFTADFAKAKDLFAKRAEAVQNAQEAARILDSITASAPSDELKFEAQVLASRAYYWVGGHLTAKDAKIAAYLAGRARGDAAAETNGDCAEGYYFAAINLGKWGLTNGILDSLRESGKLESLAKSVKNFDVCLGDDAGQSGEILDGYGADRTLGKMYSKLPPVNPYGPTGDRTRALFHLERAVKNGANDANRRVALNTVYLAQVLRDGNSAEKTRARQILQDLIATVERDPAAYNPNRLPETLDELKEAKEELSKF